uniref:Uncharacterized protein n=1 Tax=Candidatus Kentrum sp. MB TaxID=2138164 RepID=A0A451BE65_9GAMM|nr:MAG: hypothetical protein BECKMB1821G_GA0114241_10936 [Candidatus Kentron sp. MB]VFK34073.1 MAG: hypothetical protein BECKMB1821I_GA0114274_106016 [Candidatus Kentron sp. MB]VFK76572.1 MAG: hypothetical protein BECKMB1821H_GA0114242_106318 [Candidatus Kentron sp. MB]
MQTLCETGAVIFLGNLRSRYVGICMRKGKPNDYPQCCHTDIYGPPRHARKKFNEGKEAPLTNQDLLDKHDAFIPLPAIGHEVKLAARIYQEQTNQYFRG